MSSIERTLDPANFVLDGHTAAVSKSAGRRSIITRSNPFIFGPIDLNWVERRGG